MKTISISAKVSDRLNLTMWGYDDKPLARHQGYVPYVDCIGGGDYLEMEIDENGQILNWDKDCFKKIMEAIEEEE